MDFITNNSTELGQYVNIFQDDYFLYIMRSMNTTLV